MTMSWLFFRRLFMAVFPKTKHKEVELFSTISYTNEMDPPRQKVNRCRRFFQAPLEKVGQMLRDAFYLPGYSKKVDPAFTLNQRLANKMVQALKKSDVLCPDEHMFIKQSFSIQ